VRPAAAHQTIAVTLARWISPLAMATSLVLASPAPPSAARPIRWDDLPAPIQRRLQTAGIDDRSFEAFRQDHERRTQARVVEGDLDALVYFALQSMAFTKAPPIEPALSARTFVEGLDEETRKRFLTGGAIASDRVPAPARQRLTALVPALRNPPPGSRLEYFRDIVSRRTSAEPEGDFLVGQYVRAMRFLYEKEFVAQRTGADAVAALYRERGLSTDTAVEAGYLVHLGLATLKALEPSRRIRRVLVVGPGFDLAPRTGLVEAGPPESYQPYAIVDSLVSLGLARLDDLVVVGGDVNPRVVEHLEAAGTRDVSLTLVTGVGDSGAVALGEDYRRYFDAIGRAIGAPLPAPALPARYSGHLRKAVRVRSEATRAVGGLTLDIATDRVDGDGFDLVVATNVLPYLDDRLLTLALANVAAMLTPGGIFLHNESRPLLGEVTRELDLPLQQARTAVIATVGGAPPLADAVLIHEKAHPPAR
jgi:SAM-dependent methyltransferase